LIGQLAACRGEVSPDAAKLENKINTLLAARKEHMLKSDRLNSEKDQLSEQLNAATLRYFKAEKKLDRAKSAQVQKLEQQAFAKVTQPAASTSNSAEPEDKNGSTDNSEILAKYEEATAASNKQKEQLDKFLLEIRTLQEENSTLKSRKDTWTDEDFIRTDVFKQFKSQNEDLIRRINNLEATNKQLREDAEKLQAERLAFRTQLEADANQVTQELEAEIVARDQDLARVRSARDDILAENTQRKASMEQEKAAMEQIKELASAKDDRISALESEISRLRPAEGDASVPDDSEGLSQEELQQKYKKLLQDFQSINQELPSIEKAYKRMKDLAQKKVMDFAALEERVSMLIAEKSKADQKYFAARKDADTRNSEIRSLRLQNGKSAEIIAQLKDLESQSRATLSNLEKQLADLKQANATLVTENKKAEASSNDNLRRADTLNKQISDLTSLVKSKDSATAVIKERNTMQETEVEKLKVRVETTLKDRDYWRGKALSNTSVEEEGLRVSLPSSVHFISLFTLNSY
jgi:E3 ubiquitin-protein ligase BRE1